MYSTTRKEECYGLYLIAGQNSCPRFLTQNFAVGLKSCTVCGNHLAGRSVLRDNFCTIRISFGGSQFLFPLTFFSQISNDVRDNPQMYSMMFCPHPGIVPGGRFTEFYYW